MDGIMIPNILNIVVFKEIILLNIQFRMSVSVGFFLTKNEESLIFWAYLGAHMPHRVPINSRLPKSIGRSMKLLILVRVFNGEEQIKVGYFPKHSIDSFGIVLY